jgi:hypothetical protein
LLTLLVPEAPSLTQTQIDAPTMVQRLISGIAPLTLKQAQDSYQLCGEILSSIQINGLFITPAS